MSCTFWVWATFYGWTPRDVIVKEYLYHWRLLFVMRWEPWSAVFINELWLWYMLRIHMRWVYIFMCVDIFCEDCVDISCEDCVDKKLWYAVDWSCVKVRIGAFPITKIVGGTREAMHHHIYSAFGGTRISAFPITNIVGVRLYFEPWRAVSQPIF